MMAYHFLTQQHQDDEAMQAVLGREREHANYELNRQNYLAILASEPYVSLPDEWPAELVKYANVFGEELAARLNDPDYTTVVNLQFRDRVRLLLKTTIAEQAKSAAALSASTKRVPANRLTAAKARLQAKIDAGSA